MVKENVMVQTEIGLIPEDWTVRKLREVISYISYGFTNPMPTTNEGIWMVTANDVKNGEINFSTARRTSIDAFNKFLTEKSKPKQNDLLLTKDGTLGRVAVVHNDLICINQSVAVIRTNKYLNVFFLKHLLQDSFYQKVMIENAGGSTIKHIYITVVDKMPIVVPSLHEQQAIAEALSDADSWIESLEKLIDKKRFIKQSAMQQLLTPKEDWEEKKLGELGEVRMCKRVFQYQTSEYGEIPFYKIGTFGRIPDAYISRKHYEDFKSRFSFPKKGYILISAAGTIGRTVVYDGEECYFQDSNIVWIENQEEIVTNAFLKYILDVVKYNTEGGTIQRLYNNILKSTTFYCPSLAEQTRIATILSDMDAELEVLTKQLEKARKIKHGMMQELLTGKIRLV